MEASLRFSSRRWRPATTPKSMALELSAILRIGFVVYALCSIEMTVLLVGFDVFTRQRHLWWLLPTFGRAGSARAGAEDHHSAPDGIIVLSDAPLTT